MSGVKLIPLSRGLFALVDADDHARLSQHNWYAQRNGDYGYYAARTEGHDTVLMHREIMAFPDISVDHRNRDGLDNRRSNLREAGQSKNAANCKPRRNNTSGYVGVSMYRGNKSNPWTAHITVDGRKVHLGYFATAELAARARDDSARDHFGEFARLNFPVEFGD